MGEKTSINDFVSHFTTDFARSNLFHVSIDGVSLGVPNAFEHLFMSCKGVQVPGITYVEGKYMFQGFNRKIAIGADYDPVTLTFFIDGAGKTLEIFDEWSNKIFNKQTGKFGFKENYQSQISILMVNRMGEIYDTVLLINAYPTNIETVDLSWESSDTLMELSVSFNFDRVLSSYNGTIPKVIVPKKWSFEDFIKQPFDISVPTFNDVTKKLNIDIPKLETVQNILKVYNIDIPKPEILETVTSKTNLVDDMVRKAQRAIR